MNSFVFVARGVAVMVAREPNAQIHLAVSTVVIISGFLLRVPPAEWCWLIAAMASVWVAEAFNTAVEALCDRICPMFDPAIGRIKDVAAGGVLIAAMAAALIGLLVLGPRLLALLVR